MAKKPRKDAKQVGSGGPSMPEDGSWPASVCRHLRTLNAKRSQSIGKLEAATRERKALDEQIKEQKEENPKSARLDALKSRHYDVEQDVKRHRAEVRWYSDTITETIDGADQGELFKSTPTKPTDEDLFGSTRKAKDAGWKKESIDSVSGLSNAAIAALKKAELFTLGQVDGINLADIAGVGASAAKMIQDHIDARKNDRGDEDDDGSDEGDED